MNRDAQLKLADDTPYFGHLGIEVVEIGKGFARLKLGFHEHLTHPFGYFHGGAVASLADSAGINAVMTVLGDGEKALTLEMKINYLQGVKGCSLFGEARVIHRGRKFAVADVDVRSEDDKLVAKALVTCVIS